MEAKPAPMDDAAVAALRALEMQEKQLMQMLGFTEHELKKNMDVLRRDMGGVVKDTQQKVEEAIWQLACASEAAGTPSKDPQVAALEVVAAVAARAALDATCAAPPPSKSNADAVKTLRAALGMEEWKLTQLVDFTERAISPWLGMLRKNVELVQKARQDLEGVVQQLTLRSPAAAQPGGAAGAAGAAAAALPPLNMGHGIPMIVTPPGTLERPPTLQHEPPAVGARRARDEAAEKEEEQDEAAAAAGGGTGPKRAKPSPPPKGSGSGSADSGSERSEPAMPFQQLTNDEFQDLMNKPPPPHLQQPPAAPGQYYTQYYAPFTIGGAGGGAAAVMGARVRGRSLKGKGKPAMPLVNPQLASFLRRFKRYLEEHHTSSHTKNRLSALTVQNRINHGRRIFVKHKVVEVTAAEADRIAALEPRDPNVHNMLSDVKDFLRWEASKPAAGAADYGAGAGAEGCAGALPLWPRKGGRPVTACTRCSTKKAPCTFGRNQPAYLETYLDREEQDGRCDGCKKAGEVCEMSLVDNSGVEIGKSIYTENGHHDHYFEDAGTGAESSVAGTGAGSGVEDEGETGGEEEDGEEEIAAWKTLGAMFEGGTPKHADARAKGHGMVAERVSEMAPAPAPLPARPGRKRHSCEECVKQKVRCDLDRAEGNMPCTRCLNNGRECEVRVGVDGEGNPVVVRRTWD